MLVTIDGNNFIFNLPVYYNHKAKNCGARFHSPSKTWRAKATRITASAILSNFKEGEYDPAICEMVGSLVSIPPLTTDPDAVLRDVTLRSRQVLGVMKAWDKPGYALFWVMGSGKTLSTMTLANLRHCEGLIDRLLVICPTSVKGVWKKEFERYSAIPTDIQVLEAGNKLDPALKSNTPTFKVLVVGVEGLSQGGASDVATEFVSLGRTMTVVDESSRIKNYDAERTKRCCAIGEISTFRLILTGTNVTQGLHDLYAQMFFVDPTIIGEMSFFSFRNRYCVMGGFENRKMIGYTNVEALLDKIRPHCDVIRKTDMIGLPEKSYQIRQIKASPAQVKACKELAREMKTELGDREITVANALEALLRFQQISGGHMPDGTALPTNPKLSELLDVLADFGGKAIIWARYLPEIATITNAIEKVYPGSTLALQGSVPPAERQLMVDQFQSDPDKRFFISNQATGGVGLTLTAATLAIYYSNTFSLEDRMQSEDRNHRIGQENSVLYIDLISDLKVDKMVMSAIEGKRDLSNFINGELRVEDLI